MPSFTVKIPVSSSPASFARRARVRAGLGAMIMRSQVALPGPNIFKGLGDFFAQGKAALPGPNIFPAFARQRGMGEFRAQVSVNPGFPGPNVFVPYLKGLRGCSPAACASCAKACPQRGMGAGVIRLKPKAQFPHRGLGQQDGWYDPSLEDYGYNPGTAPTYMSDLNTTLDLSVPTYSVPSDLGTTLTFPTTTTYTPSSTVTLSSGAVIDTTEAAKVLANPTLTAAQTFLSAGMTAAQVAAMTATQQAAAAAKIPSAVNAAGTSTVSSTLSTFFSQYGTYIILGGLGFLGVSLIGKKKRR